MKPAEPASESQGKTWAHTLALKGKEECALFSRAFNEGGTAESSFRPFYLDEKGFFIGLLPDHLGGKNVKKQRIVIKIGSSSLTNSKGSIDEEKINDHVRAIAALKKKAMKSSSFRRGLSLRDFYSSAIPQGL